MKTPRCKNCSHWADEGGRLAVCTATEVPEAIATIHYYELGGDGAFWPMPQAPVTYRASLRTDAEFSCSQFEPRDQESFINQDDDSDA